MSWFSNIFYNHLSIALLYLAIWPYISRMFARIKFGNNNTMITDYTVFVTCKRYTEPRLKSVNRVYNAAYIRQLQY